MRAPGFWWRTPPSLTARLLSPLGWIYGGIARRRMEKPGERASIPVICIGNPVAGGAGKTPAAIEVARLLVIAGKKPVFLTRGYGGREQGPLSVDPAQHAAADVGDEPLLLVRTAPCVVARDRVAGARLAATLGDVIVMDDGFQNPSLRKSLSFLVVDYEAGIGNGLCIPAGPLRAPLEPQLQRADAVILVGDGDAGNWLAARKRPPVLRARLVPDTKSTGDLKGKRVLAFAGIGRPQKFAGTLKGLGADVVRLAGFPDHHAFTAIEARDLIEEARRGKLLLVTTEKDKARLGGAALKELRETAIAVPVRMAFDKPKMVTAGLARLWS
jgi:tetraacyldisaccharide 4'-kinase